MRRLLWVGDACVASGFARATHHTLDTLRHVWDVSVLGMNYRGDPHPYPYPVYPCFSGGDPFGIGRLVEIVQKTQPDCIVLQNDVWNVPYYMDRLKHAKIEIPVVVAAAVDGKNCQGWKLNDAALTVFWTRFAETQARLGGYTRPSSVVPLGVDLDIYRPVGQAEARNALQSLSGAKSKLPADAFLVLNVNRNQQRKRLDLTIEYFCEWVRQENVEDAYLMLHSCPTGESEYDLDQLMDYYGLRDRLLLMTPDIGQGIPEQYLPYIYSCADVQISTTQGEGFGLTTFEGMACGVPQIVPRWSALEELCEDAVLKVECTSTAVTQNRINVIGGVPDRSRFVDALIMAYESEDLRDEMRERGFRVVHQDQYRWENVGAAFAQAIDGIA